MAQQLDPALATVLVAAIGALGTWLAGRATRAGRAREQQLQQAAEKRAERDDQFEYMRTSRDAAIEDAERERAAAARYRVERDASDAHNAVLIQALIACGQPIPPRPTGGTP